MNIEKVNIAIELLKEVGEKDSVTNSDGFLCGYCTSGKRKDNTNVYFVEVKKEKK